MTRFLPDRRRRLALLAVATTLLCGSFAPPSGADPKSLRPFETIEIHVDPRGHALSGYQVIVDGPAGARLVGIEGGEGAFATPPHYDPAALQRSGSVVLLAYQLDGALPRERTRVCTLHYFRDEASSQRPDPAYTVTPVVAVDRNGQEIPARVDGVKR